MRAVIVEHRNELGALREVPDPVPKPHEILVRVAVAGVNPVDWKRRDSPDTPLPLILGQDFAGLVVGTGDRVQRYRLDERVFGIARKHGAYAEFTVVPEDDNVQPVTKIPDGVGDADAAALPTAGLTALACVERTGVLEGETLFIVGVTGVVGQFAAQIARNRGVHVAGSGSSEKMAAVDGLGLDGFVAYDREDVLAALHNAYPKGVNALLNLADNTARLNAMSAAVRPGGTVASTIHNIDETYMNSHGLRGMNINLFESVESSHEGLRRLVEMVERGEVSVPIAIERNLTDAVEALELQKSGKAAGKILITVS